MNSVTSYNSLLQSEDSELLVPEENIILNSRLGKIKLNKRSNKTSKKKKLIKNEKKINKYYYLFILVFIIILIISNFLIVVGIFYVHTINKNKDNLYHSLVNKNKEYFKSIKKVIYQCITGKYDKLIEPKVKIEGFDLILFTDNKEIKSKNWKILPIPEALNNITLPTKKNREMKINAHKYLKNYNLSIYIDGNIEILKDLNKFALKEINPIDNLYFIQHHDRISIYNEVNVIVGLGYEKKLKARQMIDQYRKEGFPEKYGLTENNIIIRKHNSKDSIKLMEFWWDRVNRYSHRDQLSFMYSLWKTKVRIKFNCDINSDLENYFKLVEHKEKRYKPR